MLELRLRPRAPAAGRFLLFLLPLVAGGCRGQQSALEPTGPAARDAAILWWVMTGAGTAIFLLVLVLLLYAVLRNPARRTAIDPYRMVVLGGIVLPVVALSALVPTAFMMGTSSYATLPPDAQSIRVTGRQWWWDIEYGNGDSPQAFTTANEIYIPVGEPVELILVSGDVIHSFWVPRLAGKQDLIPGRTNRLVIAADRQGVFRAQCAEYCGMAHTNMALYVIAVPPADFAAWLEQQRRPADPPESDLAGEGAAHFMSSGCPLCHTVRGHGAWGQEAPDLTHIGSRLTIGAALVPNTAGNIADWIAFNHRMKPGNRMPSFTHLDAETRLAIATYLESLK